MKFHEPHQINIAEKKGKKSDLALQLSNAISSQKLLPIQ